MKHALLVAFALAGLAFAPAVSAQTEAPSTVSLTIKAPEGAVPADGTTLPVRVEYCYFMLGSLAMTSTKVDLKIADEPAWASVVVTPATLLFDVSSGFPGGSTMCSAPQQATIQVVPLENATDPQPATIRLTATAKPNAPIAGSTAEDAVIVKAAEDVCHADHEESASADPAGSEAEGEGTLTAQTAGAAPVISPVNAAVVALGLAGASAGTVAAVRRRE